MAIVKNIDTFPADPVVVMGAQMIDDGRPLPYLQELVCERVVINEDPAKVIGERPGGNGMYHPGSTPGSSVTIGIYVRLYHLNPDGTKGDRVSGNAHIKEGRKHLTADNTTLVLSTDYLDADGVTVLQPAGSIVGKAGEEEIDANWAEPTFNAAGAQITPAGKFYGKRVITEGQFFDRLKRLAPVVVDTLVESYLTANKDRIQPPYNA